MPTTIWEGIIQLILAIGIGGIIGFLGLWRANLKDLKAKIKQETKIELSLNASHERMDRMEKAAGNLQISGTMQKVLMIMNTGFEVWKTKRLNRQPGGVG